MRVFHLVSRVCGEHRVRIFLSHHVPPLVGFYSFGLGHNIRDRETTALGLMRFILALRRGVLACATQGLRNLAFMAEEGPDGLARAILLLGGFMMAELGQSIHDVRVAFTAVNPVLIGAFRPPIDDLWRAIARAVALGWIRAVNERGMGEIDFATLEAGDSPVVPGHIVVVHHHPIGAPAHLKPNNPDEWMRNVATTLSEIAVTPDAIPLIQTYLEQHHAFNEAEARAWIAFVGIPERPLIQRTGSFKVAKPTPPKPPMLRSRTMPRPVRPYVTNTSPNNSSGINLAPLTRAASKGP